MRGRREKPVLRVYAQCCEEYKESERRKEETYLEAIQENEREPQSR